MKKILYTMAVNNYAPELRAITFPALEHYAAKIGASFEVITERKFPDYPVTYEKFQIYDRMKASGADWGLFIDADTYIMNDFPDVLEMVPKTNVVLFKLGDLGVRFKTNNYMRRYGRCLDVGSWFFAVSDWTVDAIKPLHLQPEERPWQELIKNIYPTTFELNGPVPVHPEHLLDDYLLCCNICKYGLKVTYISELHPEAVRSIGHTCYDTIDAKIAFMMKLAEFDHTDYWSLLKDHEWREDIQTIYNNRRACVPPSLAVPAEDRR
jgi:hypothetical protein